MVEQPGIDRQRHYRQANQFVEAGKARLQRRNAAMADTRALGKDRQNAPFACQLAGRAQHPAQRGGALIAFHRHQSVFCRQLAPHRQAHQFSLGEDRGTIK